MITSNLVPPIVGISCHKGQSVEWRRCVVHVDSSYNHGQIVLENAKTMKSFNHNTHVISVSTLIPPFNVGKW